MASSYDVLCGVNCESPESVVLPAECLQRCVLLEVPDADCFVLTVGDNDVVTWVEDHSRDVVIMAFKGINFPSLSIVDTPQLYKPIISPRHNKRLGWMERNTINTTFMRLQNKFHKNVGAPKHVVPGAPSGTSTRRTPPRDPARASANTARKKGARAPLAEARDVPDADGLVDRGTHYKVLTRMELGTHHVVIVPSHHAETGPGLPVPNADCLVVAAAENPGTIARMELDSADIVDVTEEGEKTFALLVVPDVDLVVVTAGYKKRLDGMESYATNRTDVLFKSVDENTKTVIPKLDYAVMKRGEDPWTGRMETKSLDPVALGFKLKMHVANTYNMFKCMVG